MLVQFDDDTGYLIPVAASPEVWKYENFHVDGALVERYNKMVAEFDAIHEEVERIQNEHSARRYQLGEEWAREKLAALERDGEVEWTTWQGKVARLYTRSKSAFLMSDVSANWLGYLPNGRDHVLIGLMRQFVSYMEAEWMQKLIAPPQGAQEIQGYER